MTAHVIELLIPPEKTIFVSQQMDYPYLALANPPTHILELRMDSYLPPISMPPDLVATLMIPNEVQRLMRFISQAYMSSLNHIPVSMEARIPNLAPDTLPISCLV